MADLSHSRASHSDSGDSSYETSSGSEEELVPLERPVFLKRPAGVNKEHTRDAKRRQTLMESVKYENRAIQAREHAQKQIETNYCSDQTTVRRALMLDDDDSKDPEGERQLWVQRQEARRKARTDRLIAQQLELEAYEANKLKSGERLFEKQESTNTKQQGPKPKINYHNPPSKPERVRDTNFGTAKLGAEETEYSIL